MLSIENIIRRVDLFSLKLFHTAVKEGQIGRAAAIEHIAPSAATKRIQDLEEIAGMELLQRSAKGVVPTQAGLIFTDHVAEILSLLDNMRREITDLAEGVSGHISLAAPGLLISNLLAIVIAEFKQKFPQVEVDLRHTSNADAINALKGGEVELAVFIRTSDMDISNDLEAKEWYKDPLILVVPSSHPFSRKSAVSLEQLINEDIVGIGPNTTIMKSIHRAAKQIGKEPRIKYNVSTIEAACSLVSAGLGLAMLPSSVQFFWKDNNLCAVKVEGEWTDRSYCIGKRANRPPTPAAEALIDQLTTQKTALTRNFAEGS